ncbi:MAG: primosomal protein N' [Rhodospirillales bacterium]|nr:primosomal protein N' [Rhodospirillales bacterium]MSP80158.1 primosomal protein N' [Rhodospirillales bacterium]
MDSPDSIKTQYVGGETVSVLLPLPLAGAYDYRVPSGAILRPGDFVAVPLGRRRTAGVVWGPGSGEVADNRLKDIGGTLALPSLPSVSRRFVDWVADYTLAPPGAVLKMAMSVKDALTPAKPIVGYVRNPDPRPRGGGPSPGLKLTAARQRVLDCVGITPVGVHSHEGPPRIAAEIARAAGTSAGVVKALAAAGALLPQFLPATVFPRPDWTRPGPTLSPEQSAAADALAAKADKGGFSVTVLDGVPGAGKTEVYFHAVASALKAGRQALILLPEIALGAQWLQRFRDRFGAAPAVWHSDVPESARRATWRAVAEGRARVVFGARSALFLPFPELGLVVVDEEHDASYKQEDGVIYNARDMAVVRARLGSIPVVLASATPALETVANVAAGRYGLHHLPDRHGGARMPEVARVDMRAEKLPAGRWLSAPLTQALGATLAEGEQAMLFLNRRGYAPLTLCRGCGHRMRCPNCSAWLVEHRSGTRAKLRCHHCGFAAAVPNHCPACQAEANFAACGPGVERLADEARQAFPSARIALAASDTLAGPEAAAEFVRRVEAGAIDLIVGTQIVAKGYHFPRLTLVGVVDADLGLAGGDLRAAERTYQLLYQLAGRAGRGERPGKVLLQTYMPEHPVMAAIAATARDRFLAAETEARREAAMPPFARLVALIVSGPKEPEVERAARMLARAAPSAEGVRVLGPAPAPLALLRGRHRRRLLLKAPRGMAVQPMVRAWLASVEVPRSVRVQADVDPYSFL